MVNRVAEDTLQGNQHFHRIISLSLKKSMKRDQELIVITKTYDLILWSCNHTSRFPRNHRFVLGERIERNLYNLLETLIAASTPRTASGSSKTPTWHGKSSPPRCGWRKTCNA